MKQKKCLILLLALVAMAAVSGCGGRGPSPKVAQRVIRHEFHHYGKKYKESVFGKSKVKEIEIVSTEEIHKHLVAVTSFLTLENNEVLKVRVTMEKKSFGWRYVSWEKLL